MKYMVKNTNKNEFPENREYVLVYVNRKNWHDSRDICDKRFWRVARFVKGISIDERVKMEEVGNPRANEYCGCDEHGNNKKPYSWEEFGPDSYFGQEINYWIPLMSKDELLESVHTII